MFGLFDVEVCSSDCGYLESQVTWYGKLLFNREIDRGIEEETLSGRRGGRLPSISPNPGAINCDKEKNTECYALATMQEGWKQCTHNIEVRGRDGLYRCLLGGVFWGRRDGRKREREGGIDV